MSDYINRKDALICLPQYPLNYNKEQADAFLNGYYQMWKNVENCAAADVVERKHGKWISMMGHSICNVCGYKGSPILTNFCPNCGSDMKTQSIKQLRCKKCGSEMFEVHGTVVICLNCGADMRGDSDV